MPQPNRRVGTAGIVSYAGVPVDYRASWSFDSSATLEEIKGQGYIWKKRVFVSEEWEAGVDLELPTISRDLLPVVSIGSIIGLIIQEWSLKIDLELKDCAGQNDPWQIRVPTGLDASFDITSWIPSTTWGAFMAAAKAQADTGAVLNVVTPFGAFTALSDSAGVKDDAQVMVEDMKMQLAGATFVPGSYLTPLFVQIQAIVASLEARQTPLASSLVMPCGTGLAYLSNLELSAPEGHITGSVKFSGTGEFLPASS